jgi:hypothetical protein
MIKRRKAEGRGGRKKGLPKTFAKDAENCKLETGFGATAL